MPHHSDDELEEIRRIATEKLKRDKPAKEGDSGRVAKSIRKEEKVSKLQRKPGKTQKVEQEEKETPNHIEQQEVKPSKAHKRERSAEPEEKPDKPKKHTSKKADKSDVSEYEEELENSKKTDKGHEKSEKGSEKRHSEKSSNSKKPKKDKRSSSKEVEPTNKPRKSRSKSKTHKKKREPSRSKSRQRKEKPSRKSSTSPVRSKVEKVSQRVEQKRSRSRTRRDEKPKEIVKAKERKSPVRSRQKEKSRSRSRHRKRSKTPVKRSRSRSKHQSKTRRSQERENNAKSDEKQDKQKNEKEEEGSNGSSSGKTESKDEHVNGDNQDTSSEMTEEEKRKERKRTRKSGWDDRSQVQGLALTPGGVVGPASTVQQLIQAQLQARTQQMANQQNAQKLLALQTVQQEQAAQFAKQQQILLANRLLQATMLQQQQAVPAVDPLIEQQQIIERRVYVGSLSYDLTEEHIRAPFASFGNIVKIDMPREAGLNRSKGFCFVEYDSKQAADVALSTMNGFMLAGRPIRVGKPSSANAGVAPILPPTVASAGGPLLTAPVVGGSQLTPQQIQNLQRLAVLGLVPGAAPAVAAAGQAALLQLATAQQQNAALVAGGASQVLPAIGLTPHIPQPQPVANKNRIYVGSVFWDLTADHLKAVFEAFGKVVAVELIPNPETGKHKGYGFVEFANEKSAEDAMTNMNGFELCGRQLKVGRAQYSMTAKKPDGDVVVPPISNAPSLLPIPDSLLAASPTQANQDGSSKVDLDSLEGQPQIDRFTLMKRLMESREGPQSNVVVLKNMITKEGLDPGFEQEVREECESFGVVVKVAVHVLPDGKTVFVFVQFKLPAQAVKAKDTLHKRWFDGRVITAEIYDQSKFEAGIYA